MVVLNIFISHSKTVLIQGWTFLWAISHTLLHYRATQHSTTGVYPAFLILGCELHLVLDRLSPAVPQEPLPSIRASVTWQQRRMEQKFDFSACVKVPDIKACRLDQVSQAPQRQQTCFILVCFSPSYSSVGPSHLLAERWHTVARKPPPQSAPQATSPAWQDTPALKLAPQKAPVRAPDMPINLPAEMCACPHPHVSPHGLFAFVLVQDT